MGQACVKGPKSAGKQKTVSRKAAQETAPATTTQQLEVHIPEGLDSTALPEAKDSYDSASIQTAHHNAHPAESLDPINITATADGHTSNPAPTAHAGVVPNDNVSSLPEPLGSKPTSSGNSHSEAEADSSSTSNVELLRNYAQLAEMLHFSPYPLLLIDIEVEAQPMVFVSQVQPLDSGKSDRSCLSNSVVEHFNSPLTPPVPQALLKILDYSEEDLLEKPW